jgi:hypothetical protein
METFKGPIGATALLLAVMGLALTISGPEPAASEASCIDLDRALSERVKAEIDEHDWSNLGGFAAVLNNFGLARRYCRAGQNVQAVERYRKVDRTLKLMRPLQPS